MEDEAGHRKHHTTDGTIFWTFNLSVSFLFYHYNVITYDSCVPNFSGLDPLVLLRHLQLSECTNLH